MALSCGFYNSSNGDRKYNSVDFSRIFDGIITDGIYATYEKAMVVKASENAGEVIIQPGRAWFNHSWSYNDADYVMEAPAPEVLLDRIDALVLDVNSEMATRDNTFMWVTGTPASNPERPTLIRSVTHNQYPLCYVRRYAETTMIYAKDITNAVGTSECPFVTGVLEGINIDDMLSQWDDEFHTWENATKLSFEGWMVNQKEVYTRWWEALKTQMAGDVANVEAWVQTIRGIIDSEAATHLQAEIDELNEWVPNGSYLRIVTEEQELFSRAVTISDLAGHSQTENFDANGVVIFKSFPYVGTLNIASSNGARTAVQTITVPYFTRMENIQLAFWSATVNIEADIEMAGYTVTVKDSNDATVTTVVLNANAEGIFRAQAPDTYKFQVTYGGETMEVSLAVTEETTYSVSISAGFNWRRWCEAGEVSTSGYNSLDDVLADGLAVRKLMTKHASSDYLIEGVSIKPSVIDDFCDNDNAMKWIGLRDYVCDGLTAIAGVEAKFLASQYWERYLKDHVPTMTANNAPYGVASAQSNKSGAQAPYTTFDGNITSTSASYGAPAVDTAKTSWWGFQFTNPICVKKAIFYAWISSASKNLTVSAKIQGSNDGTNWTDIGTAQTFTINGQDLTPHEVDVPSNASYYLYQRLELSSDDYLGASGSYATHITSLQFYGRQLSVSVPIMTSNTAPYGTVSGNGSGGYGSYHAFSNSSYAWNSGNLNAIYDFGKPVVVKAFSIASWHYGVNRYKIIGSNDGTTWVDVLSNIKTVIPSLGDGTVGHANVENTTAYRYYGFEVSGYSDSYLYPGCNFYGLDYSEREFEEGTNKKWLYDHGLELEPIDVVTETVTKGTDSIRVERTVNRAARWKIDQDLTNYSLARARVDGFLSDNTFLNVTDTNNQDIAYIAVTNSNAPNNIALGISAIDGNARIGMQANTVGVYNTATELWLEQ